MISADRLREILLTTKGAQPVSLQTVTEPKLRAGHPFRGLVKRSRFVGWVGSHYERGVIREGERQGKDCSSFEAEGRPWGKWVIFSKLSTHNGNFYLRTQSTPGQRRHRPVWIEYLEQGKKIAAESVEPWLVKSISNKQREAGLMPGRQIEVREFRLDLIRRIRVAGKKLIGQIS